MRKINEIFYSLQGEGFHVGTPALFIRFSGCNLHCDFCDTKHTEGEYMDDEEILLHVRQCPAKTVILTGGEPSLSIDSNFVDMLHKEGKFVCVETNGTHKLPENSDWITCSPKENSIIKLQKANEVKIVYTQQDVEQYYHNIKAQYYFLQPCSCKNTDEVIEYIKKHPWWRLSLQTHKLINIP